MIAGEVFMQPEEGALRLVIGKVYAALDEAARPGFLVQEFVPKTDKDGFELVTCEWVTVCPLTDADFTLPYSVCPGAWREASRELRALIEAGQPVSIDVERAALLKRGPMQIAGGVLCRVPLMA